MKLFRTLDLICPSCKNSFDADSNELRCIYESCKQRGKVKNLENAKPILLNLDNTIFSQERLLNTQAKSVLKRSSIHSLIGNLIKLILNGSNSKTKTNISHIVKQLTKIPNPRILIIGGGTRGMGTERLYKTFKNSIIAFDVYDSDNVDFIGDANDVPFGNEVFDFVLIQAVLEHVENPTRVVAEIHRVLKDKGIVYAETPFLQHVHEGAYDFTRYTVFGHRMLFKNFDKVNMGFIGGLGQSFLWSIENFSKALFRSRIIGKMFKITFSWIRLLELIISNEANDDGACGCFFYGTKNSNKNQNSLIKYLVDYQGNQ